MLPHLDQIDKLMKEGVGLACLHYAVAIPKGRLRRSSEELDRRLLRGVLVGQSVLDRRLQTIARSSHCAGRQTVCH